MPEEENGEKKDERDVAPEPEKRDAEEAKELRDRMLRLAAEFDNYKKRTAKDIAAASEKGRAEAIMKLLPVIDEFELAISSMDMKQELSKGISLIYSNFISTLKSMGLKQMDAKGKYDPYRHEIVLAQESDKEEGTILEVVRKGYLFNDVMIRPASVIISMNGAKKEDADGKEKGDLENKK